jgi:hypothetical protein
MLQANLAMGVQACYRGPRLFDTEATKQMVAENVAWFKKYRDILESDVVHGRRADGRDLDWTLHVNPRLAEKGMLVVFNPGPETVRKTLDVNLYYTGITDEATVAASDATPVKLRLGRDYRVRVPVEVPAGGMAWYTIR